jgi:hypothetical protein
MELAPIVLFVYNRPEHTLATLEALEKNELAKESILYVFADGAKAGASEDSLKDIENTRQAVKSKPWCKSVIIENKSTNNGLAKSIIEGVTKVVNEFGKIIVLEDDIVVAPYFLDYMNELLQKYEQEERIISIHGYNYPFKYKGKSGLILLKGADCWGWATWRRGWNLFKSDSLALLREIEQKKRTYEFDFSGTYPFTDMLREQTKGYVSSWAIRWYASAFIENKLTIYPTRSIVKNIGFDSSGTHSGATNDFDISNFPEKFVFSLTGPIEENKKMKKMVEKYFSKMKKNSSIRKILLYSLHFLVKRTILRK